MNDAEYLELRDASWRRKLTPAEEARVQAHLAAHPKAQAEWEDDLVLTRALQDLPDVPLSSNFTSLILQAVDSQNVSQPGGAALKGRWSGWVGRLAPRFALAAVVAAIGITSLHEYQSHTRKQLASDVERFVTVANLPDPEVLEDFDAIQRLQPVAFSKDDDLLAALQ